MSMGSLIIGSFVASNMFHLDNPKNIIFSYININSIRNKFENLCEIVENNVDVLSIAETKFDSSFPNAQFVLSGFHKQAFEVGYE